MKSSNDTTNQLNTILTQEEWASMLFSDKKHVLDREKKIQRLQDIRRLQLLKRGLRQYE